MNGYLDCNCQESIKCFLLCRAQEQPLAQGSAGGVPALLGLLCEGCGPPSWEDTGLGAASTEVWYSGVICTLLKKKNPALLIAGHPSCITLPFITHKAAPGWCWCPRQCPGVHNRDSLHLCPFLPLVTQPGLA